MALPPDEKEPTGVDAERRQRVEELLSAALEREPAQRSRFLEEVCLGDHSLRREVETLIDASEMAGGLYESAGAGAASGGQERSLVGQTLGRYHVLSSLGAGGMGEVYLAWDSELERQVALKVLPSDVASDRQRMNRFVQEAKAAAALNHPNVAHIYEIREAGGAHFIAMEYIDGETLREKIHRDKSDLKRLLEWLAQVADGLIKAHAAGVVHRDLKPDNVMVTRDGYAKILDFGLAKLLDQGGALASTQGDASTARLGPQTRSGLIMGTVGYMSPEQAQGKPVDQRSDIFSFGCILFEAATGQKPFDGDSVIDTLHKIINAPVPPIKNLNPLAPAELQRIVRRCLAKDPEERFQTIKDVALDLKELRRDIESGEVPERLAPPPVKRTSGAGALPVVESGPVGRDTGDAARAVPTQDTGPPHRASSAEYVFGEVKKNKKAVMVGVAALVLVVLVAAAYVTDRLPWPGTPARAPAAAQQAMKIVRMTNTGGADQAAISPDGRYVVHVVSEGGRQGLRLRQVNISSGEQEVVPAAEVRYTGLTFSRDGESIYYVISGKGSALSSLYQVPALGGTSRKITSDVNSPVTFSPDGRRLAFIRDLEGRGEQALVTANADGTDERVNATRKFPNFFRSVSWSPDGKTFACAAGSYVPVINSYVVEVPVGGGPEKQLSQQSWFSIGQVSWLQDGSGLILNASEPDASSLDSSQLWHLSYPDGNVRRVTTDLNNYSSVSLTADSRRLVAVQWETASNIWLVAGGNAGRAEQITAGAGRQDGREGIAWTPDGRIVYTSNEAGRDDLWVMGPDGGGRRQLTSDSGINSNPSVCPGGRSLVFTSTRSGAPRVWRMDLEGGGLKQLTSGSGENYAQCVAGGGWAVYTLFAGNPTLWRVPMDGGVPTQLSEKNMSSPAASPDGRMVAAVYRGEKQSSPARIAVTPAGGGEIMKVFDAPERDWNHIRWSPDGRALTYIVTAGGVSNIWSQPMTGGPPKLLTNFKSGRMFRFDWSPDGQQIACSRGTESKDVVLIDNFK